MQSWVVGLETVDRAATARVGGKGARLGELRRIEGVRVPDGFCVTTDAFAAAVAADPEIAASLDALATTADPRGRLGVLRDQIAAIPLPSPLVDAITTALARLGEVPVAVRSSATTEDRPDASFAGQHDSFLDLHGLDAVLDHVRRCWASLFTERAERTRRHHRLAATDARMAVVVQRMLTPQASGVLFTADPVSGHRRITAIEAVSGLGEELVAGRAPAEHCTVRDGVVRRTTAMDLLDDALALELDRIGRRIEAHFGRPQDIEWCLVDRVVHVVQSRPITTLFPVPDGSDDRLHVYLSVSHQQMMTDAMRPLGLSVWLHTTPRPMVEAGCRLWVDVTAPLATVAGREALLTLTGRTDPLTRDALRTVLDRGEVPLAPPADPPAPGPGGAPDSEPAPPDPDLPAALIAERTASIARLGVEIEGRSGADLLAFILEDLKELQRLLFEPRSHQVVMAGLDAAFWLDEHLSDWLGERGALDALSLALPHDVTAEMGLALLDVADVIRPYPEVVALLEEGAPDALDALPGVAGGPAAHAAIRGWLHRYGMRGVGEIDLTRPRFSDAPATLFPLLLAHVHGAEPGESARRTARGQALAVEKRAKILDRLRALPDGEHKARQAARRIDLVRAYGGYREFPKFAMIARYAHYRRALGAEAERLVRAGALSRPDDLYFLSLAEIGDLLRGDPVDEALIATRRRAIRAASALSPPRVLTSDGEALNGAMDPTRAPDGTLVGVPVSSGVVEGRARVVQDVADARLEPGDILVTVYTDPSWTPVFLAAAALVTEVGGTMSHGSVVARELGLPAVVGVHGATRHLRDGDRIRVDGARGWVQRLGSAQLDPL